MLFPPVAKTFIVILTITNAISKNLISSGTKWLPIMTCIHPPWYWEFYLVKCWKFKSESISMLFIFNVRVLWHGVIVHVKVVNIRHMVSLIVLLLITINMFHWSFIVVLSWGPSWSYGSWISNYVCSQCLSPLQLRVWTLLMAMCTQYNIM